jgi:hypothetical protein
VIAFSARADTGGARRALVSRVLIPAWAVLACILAVAHAPQALRAPVVILFLCVVPGAAIVRLLEIDALAIELALAVGLSLALSGVTAAGLLYAHLWSPLAVLLIVAGATVAVGLRDLQLGRLGGVAMAGGRQAVRVLVVSARRALFGLAAPGMAIRLAALWMHRHAGDIRLGERARWVVAAVPRGRGSYLRGRVGAALATPPSVVRRVGPRAWGAVTSLAQVSPPGVRSRVASAPTGAFHGVLLETIRLQGGSRRGALRLGSSRALAQLEPQKLDLVLSWQVLQRVVTQRVVQKMRPEVWLVDDLGRRVGQHLRSTAAAGSSRSAPRGVCVTGVSETASIPVAWRVLDADGAATVHEWRTRLAFEAIDGLDSLDFGSATVAAGPVYGSLTGFRNGLEARGIRYLVRIDSATAARELARGKRSGSAAEAREVVNRHLARKRAVAASYSPQPDPDGPALPADEEYVALQVEERLVICAMRPAEKQPSVFWLTNLPKETPLETIVELARLADRHRVNRSGQDFFPDTIDSAPADSPQLQNDLALLALAQGIRALEPSRDEES